MRPWTDLGSVFLVLGAYTLAIQVILLRECFVLFSGNELSLALQLGLWLGGTAIGGLVGGALQARRWLPVLLVSLPVAGIAAPILVRVVPALLPISPGETTPLTWALVALLCAQTPLNLVAGALFPITCEHSQDRSDSSVIGRGYLLEALGAGLAGPLVTLLLSGRFRGIDLAVAISGIVAAWVAWRLSVSASRRRFLLWVPAALLLGVGLLGVGLLGGPADRLDEWWWSQAHPGWQRLATIESHYQRLDLAERQGQRTVLLNGQPALSYEPSFTASPGYRIADLFLGLHPEPRRVLVLGQGEPGLVTRLLEHPLDTLSYVVLDPALLEVPGAGDRPWSDPRLSIRLDDGRRFLRNSRETFDLVILDLPTPVSAGGNRFFTVEAFSSAGEHLQAGGLLVLRLPSSGHYLGGESERVLAAIRNALQEAFQTCELLAGEEMVLVAGAGVDLPSLAQLAEDLASRDAPLSLSGSGEITDRTAKAALYHALLEDYFNELRHEQQLQALDQLSATAESPKGRGLVIRDVVNSDGNPIAYSINLRRWLHEIGFDTQILGHGLGLVERGVAVLRRLWLPVIGAAGLLAVGVLAVPHSRRPLLATAMLTSGWAGMAGELAIAYGFQNAFGSLYQAIGGLLAAYMLGLAAGGRLLAKRIDPSFCTRALPVLRLLMIGTCLAASRLGSTTPAPLFFLVLFGYALLLGAEYPVANHLCCHESGRQRAAGLLHGMDHLGAALATLLGGTLLLPLVGAGTLLLSIACLHTIMLLPLSVSAARHR